MTLLSVDDLRLWPEFAAVDTAVLTLLLEAEELAITRELGGPAGSVTEIVDGGLLTMLTTRRRIGTLTSITETIDEVETSLAADDYRVALDRRTLVRLGTGTNPSARWPRLVATVYVPEDDLAIRKRVQRELVALDLNQAPGATSEQIGSWMEQQQKNSAWNQQTERAAILATLWPTDGIDFA